MFWTSLVKCGKPESDQEIPEELVSMETLKSSLT